MKRCFQCVIAWASLVLPLLLGACATSALAPRWQVDAATASERFVEAWLVGDRRVEQVEFDRARERVARTGRPDLVARIELLRCAARLATLLVEPCAGFDALKDDLGFSAERVYADYLSAQLLPNASARIALLPPAQRVVAALPLELAATRADSVLADIDDPLSRLVAAAVLLQSGRATDQVIATAVDTASSQGWRRALLAWLTLQRRRADTAGDAQLAQRAQRRIELIAPSPAQPATP